MTHVLKALPFLAAISGAPALAAGPDPHAGHHPTAVAETAKPATPTVTSGPEPAQPKCPMMNGKPTGGSDPTPGKVPDVKMDGKDMHCMPAPAKGATQDHDHPEAAPKRSEP